MNVGMLTDQDSASFDVRTPFLHHASHDHDEFTHRLERLRSSHSTSEAECPHSLGF